MQHTKKLQKRKSVASDTHLRNGPLDQWTAGLASPVHSFEVVVLFAEVVPLQPVPGIGPAGTHRTDRYI